MIKQVFEALVDEHEAAKALAMSVATLRTWRWSGRGPVYKKIGSAVRYAVSDIQSYVENATRTSTSDLGERDDG